MPYYDVEVTQHVTTVYEDIEATSEDGAIEQAQAIAAADGLFNQIDEMEFEVIGEWEDGIGSIE